MVTTAALATTNGLRRFPVVTQRASRGGWQRPSEDVDVIEALRSGNVDHTRDALIAATAIYEDVLW
jgi:hypothetical protein